MAHQLSHHEVAFQLCILTAWCHVVSRTNPRLQTAILPVPNFYSIRGQPRSNILISLYFWCNFSVTSLRGVIFTKNPSTNILRTTRAANLLHHQIYYSHSMFWQVQLTNATEQRREGWSIRIITIIRLGWVRFNTALLYM